MPMAFLRISTFGIRWFGFGQVRFLSSSKASFTFRSRLRSRIVAAFLLSAAALRRLQALQAHARHVRSAAFPLATGPLAPPRAAQIGASTRPALTIASLQGPPFAFLPHFIGHFDLLFASEFLMAVSLHAGREPSYSIFIVTSGILSFLIKFPSDFPALRFRLGFRKVFIYLFYIF